MTKGPLVVLGDGAEKDGARGPGHRGAVFNVVFEEIGDSGKGLGLKPILGTAVFLYGMAPRKNIDNDKPTYIEIVRIRAHTHTHTHTHSHTHTHTCTHTQINTHKYTIHVCPYTCTMYIHIQCTHACMCACTCIKTLISQLTPLITCIMKCLAVPLLLQVSTYFPARAL